MARESYNYRVVPTPFDRNTIRLHGLRSLAMVTESSLRDPMGRPSDEVLAEVFHLIELMSEDIQRDMLEDAQDARDVAAKLEAAAK